MLTRLHAMMSTDTAPAMSHRTTNDATAGTNRTTLCNGIDFD
jgi:hypothetical protein